MSRANRHPLQTSLALASVGMIGILSGCERTAVGPAEALEVTHSSEETSGRPTLAPRDAVADELWQKSNTAARSVPLRATVTITRWPTTGNASGTKIPTAPETTVITVATGGAGQYRHTYRAPASAAGRVVISDGKTIWQYEPQKKTVLRRQIPTPDPLVEGEPPAVDNATHRLESSTAMVAGRPTKIVTQLFTSGSSGSKTTVWERRWLDTTTNRSLKIEDYTPEGKLLRRVEMADVELPAPLTPTDFLPDFPDVVRTIATKPHETKASPEAARLHLPEQAGAFQLKRVLRPKVDSGESTPGHRTTQLLYSDGTHALSVFVAENVSPKGQSAMLRPGNGWKRVTLSGGQEAFAQENTGTAGSALVWTATNHRYTAMAKLPLAELIPIVQLLATRTHSR